MKVSNLSTGNRGGIIINNREFVCDILPSTDFTKIDYDINPGLYQSNPWLADIAAQYEQYQIRAMLFEYKSLCSDSTSVSNTMGLGSVIMAINYNQFNEPFTDKRSMEHYSGATSKKPTESNIIVLDIKAGQNPIPGLKWCRSTPVPTDSDIRLYDHGRFSIATQGQPGDISKPPLGAKPGTIGELWVAYEIEFFKPKYASTIGENLLMDHYFNVPLSIPYDQAAPFGVGSAITPDFRIPTFNKLKTVMPKSTTDGSIGYSLIRWFPEHQGMTFFVIITYIGDAYLDPLAQPYIVKHDDVELLNVFHPSAAKIFQLSEATNSGQTQDSNVMTGVFCIRIPFSSGKPFFDCQWKYTNLGGVPLPTNTSLDVYVIQVNGTIPNNGSV